MQLPFVGIAAWPGCSWNLEKSSHQTQLLIPWHIPSASHDVRFRASFWRGFCAGMRIDNGRST